MPAFFSLDPDAFENPKSCIIQNGSTIYLSHSIPDRCTCVAPIAADPDFAGPGVIASFCFLAWLTIFVATVPAFYNVRIQWQQTGSSRRFLQFLGLVLSIQVHQHDTKSEDLQTSPNVVLPSEEKPLAERESPLEPVIVQPRPIAAAKTLLMTLADIQILTGLAIVVAAFAQIRSISFYHEQFTTNLWWLALNSIWVSRVDYNEDSPMMNTWRMQIRRCLLIVSVVLSSNLQLWVALRERNDWDPLNGKKCYENSQLGSNFGQNIFWFAGTSVYGLILLSGVFQSSRRWIGKHLFQGMPKSLDSLLRRLQASQDRFKSQRDAISLLKLAANAIAFATWWALVQFLSIWSAGNSAPILELIVYSVFAGSSTWWVIALKANNKHLIQGDESTWTFGQSFAVLVSGLVVFAGFDASARSSSDVLNGQ